MNGKNTIGDATNGWNTASSKVKFTPEGGLAVKLINKTGALSIKGTILEAENTTDRGVELAAIDDPDPMGIMYDDGIPDGEEVWVIVTGVAEVLYSTIVNRGTFSRVPVAGEGGINGYAINEALPSPPLSTDKHFQEIGHPLESIGSPGLALTVLHFN